MAAASTILAGAPDAPSSTLAFLSLPALSNAAPGAMPPALPTPTGTPTVLAAQVHSFELLGKGPADQGVIVLSGTGATRGLRLLRDPSAPDSAQTIFVHPQSPEAVRVAPDLRHTAWITNDFIGRVVRHADLSSCALATTANSEVFEVGFAGAELVLWSESAGQAQERNDGYLAPRDNCRAAVRYARGLQRLHHASDQGVVFADEFDEDSQSVTLKFARVVASDATGAGPPRLGRAVRIAEGVHQYVTVIEDDSGQGAAGQATYVTFRTTSQSKLPAGLYLFGPIPFTKAPTTP